MRGAYREAIAGLPPEEAVEHLLAILEDRVSDPLGALATIVAETSFQRAAAIALLILWDMRGRIATNEYLHRRITELRGVILEDRGPATYIKRLRRALEATDYPLEVVTHHGVGYQLVQTDPAWRAPWDPEGVPPPAPPRRPRPTHRK